MRFSQAIDTINRVRPDSFSSLADVLSPELIDTCLEQAGVTTLRKRRLPLDLVVWSIMGMTLFRHIPMGQVVNQPDIVLPGKRPFVAPSAVVQARQRLGSDAVRRVFEQTRASGTLKRINPTGAHGVPDGGDEPPDHGSRV